MPRLPPVTRTVRGSLMLSNLVDYRWVAGAGRHTVDTCPRPAPHRLTAVGHERAGGPHRGPGEAAEALPRDDVDPHGVLRAARRHRPPDPLGLRRRCGLPALLRGRRGERRDARGSRAGCARCSRRSTTPGSSSPRDPPATRSPLSHRSLTSGARGCTKSGRSMPCPAFLAHISAMTRSASSSSEAPARIGPRRSTSCRAKRQLRSWPSAVSRARSQAPQNGAVTLAMTPTVCGPPSTRNSSAGALPRSSTGVRRKRSPSRSRISACGHHLRAVPGVLGVERHLLDEAQLVAAVEAPLQQVGARRRR